MSREIRTEDELRERLEQLPGEARSEVQHFTELDYPPALIFEELDKRIGVGESGWTPNVFHPNSKEATEIRKIGIDLGFYEDFTDRDLGHTWSGGSMTKTKPDFVMDGRQYKSVKSYSQLREELEGGA